MGGQEKNNSQFFITLGPCSWLNKKYTIFAKITGETNYNVLQFNKLKVDEKDRPLITKKIIFSKVLLNPFPDIIPRKKRRINKINNRLKNVGSLIFSKTSQVTSVKVKQRKKRPKKYEKKDLLLREY